jgi:hypothetical protein
MGRKRINYLVDIGLTLAFISTAATGLVKFPGLARYIGISHKSLPMREISVLHDWSGITLAMLVAVHIILH